MGEQTQQCSQMNRQETQSLQNCVCHQTSKCELCDVIANAVSNLTGSRFREDTNFLQHPREIFSTSLTSVMGMGIFLTELTEVRRPPFHLAMTQIRERTVLLFASLSSYLGSLPSRCYDHCFHSSLTSEPKFLNLSVWTDDKPPLRNPPGLWCQGELQRSPVLWT